MKVVRRACALLLVLPVAVATNLLPSTARAAAPATLPAQTAAGAPATSAGAQAGGHSEGEPAASISVALGNDKRTYRLQLTPRRSVADAGVTFRLAVGNKVVLTRTARLGNLTEGVLVAKTFDGGTAPTTTYAATVELTDANGTSVAGSSLAIGAVRGDLVTAATFEQLENTKIEYAVRKGWLSKTAADEQRRTRVKSDPGKVTNSLAAGLTVSGVAKYTDGRSVTLPIRNALVQLWRGSVVGTARTSATGAYSITLGTGTAGTYSVRVIADMGNGSVLYPNNQQYIGYGPSKVLSDGMTWTGANITTDRDSDTGHAFAALDALKTMSDYYLAKKLAAWPAGLNIRYPSGDGRSYAQRADHVIYIAGGNVPCGAGWCKEDAFDWDVIAHEVGHIVAYRAEMDTSPGGDHNVCDDAWDTRDKSSAARLAWSEGWASFWGQVALYEVAKPAGVAADIGDGRYQDSSWPPHNAGGGPSYGMETGCPSGGVGETSEMAVQTVLWDLFDAANDGENFSSTSAQLYAAIWAAKPTTLTPAIASIWAGRNEAERERATGVLRKGWLNPLITSHTSGPVSALTAPEFRWQPGGTNAHPNNGFTFIVRRAGSTTRLADIYLGNQVKFQPGNADWRVWTAGGGTLVVEIEGTQTESPVTGPYTSIPVKLTIGTTKVMVVGDSISQGHEGDFTWRYRLASHLGPDVDFVGPWKGTTDLPATLPAGWPDTAVPPEYNGAYRPGISFDSDHYARWGRQLHEAKDNIRSTVTAENPKYILLELGFNDLGWGVSGPNELYNDLKTFIAQARLARADVNFLVANVTQRTPLGSNPGLPANISGYNTILANSVSSLSTTGSTVALVDIDGPMTVPDTYDGLHPNGVGEFKIAKAFADVLSSRFGIGAAFGTVPSTVAPLNLSTPAGIQAVATDAGITISWNHVFGAGGYWLEQRNVTQDPNAPWERTAAQIPADSWRISWVFRGNTYQFRVITARGDAVSGTSAVASAVANPKTADGPTVTKSLPGSNYIDLTWTPPTGDYSGTVSSYIVYYLDENEPGAWISSLKTSGTSLRIPNLVSGHRYNIAIASVNAAGDGLPSGSPGTIPGAGTPGVPGNFTAKIAPDNAYSALLAWSPVSGAAGYTVQQRNWFKNEPYHELFFPVVGRTNERVDLLIWDGAAAHQFCVKAFNGTLVSAWSSCLIPSESAPLQQQKTATPPQPRQDSLKLESRYRLAHS